MSKYIFLIIFSFALCADDLDLGDDFAAGEVVKAEDFNTKFSLIENQEAELTNSFFVGSWTCKGPSTNGFGDNVTYISNDFFGDVNNEGFSDYATGAVTFALDNDGFLSMSNNTILFNNDQPTATLHFDAGYIWDKIDESAEKSKVYKVSSTKFYFNDRSGPRFTCTKS